MNTGIEFWVQVAAGCISLSALLMIVTLGLTMVFGITRVVNFAHGSLYALGAYLGYGLASLGLNFFVVLVLSPLVMMVVGVLIERLLIAPLKGRDPLEFLLMTFGLTVLIDGVIKVLWGSSPHSVDVPSFLSRTITVGGISYPFYRVFMIAVTAAACAGLLFLLQKTRTGLAMRAASRIPEMVSVLGINMNFLHSFVFGLGCFLGGLGGVVAGPLLTVYPMMGTDMLVNCFVVLVVGGLGSLRGAVVSALLIGTVQTLGYVCITDFASVIIFVLMAGILLFMPRGLIGEGRFE